MQTTKRNRVRNKRNHPTSYLGKSEIQEFKSAGRKIAARWKTILPVVAAVAAGAYFIKGKDMFHATREGLSR